MSEIIFFKLRKEFYNWLEKNYDKKEEQWVGFFKKDSGKPSITWSESVDAAICFGWIDGIRKRIDDESYKIRFTPRKPKSTWSALNIKKINELLKLGLMHPAGLKKFNERNIKKPGEYSYENKPQKLDPVFEKEFKKNKKAWKYFNEMPAWYKKTSNYWIMSAKKDETRHKRLLILIESSANEKSIAVLERKKSSK